MPRIDYGAGLVIDIPEGMTILEASLQHGLDHQHMAQTCAALPLVSKSWRALKIIRLLPELCAGRWRARRVRRQGVIDPSAARASGASAS